MKLKLTLPGLMAPEAQEAVIHEEGIVLYIHVVVVADALSVVAQNDTVEDLGPSRRAYD